MNNRLKNEYGRWIGSMKWDYMLTLRTNYKLNEERVHKVSKKLYKDIPIIDRMVYVGERDKSKWKMQEAIYNLNETVIQYLEALSTQAF